MEPSTSPPGITVKVDDEAVFIRIERDFARPMLSILLHSKFSDGPRMEFLTSPHANRLIEVLIEASSLPIEDMAVPKDLAQAFAPVIQCVEDWARHQKLPADEAASLLQSALYPYNLI